MVRTSSSPGENQTSLSSEYCAICYFPSLDRKLTVVDKSVWKKLPSLARWYSGTTRRIGWLSVHLAWRKIENICSDTSSTDSSNKHASFPACWALFKNRREKDAKSFQISRELLYKINEVGSQLERHLGQASPMRALPRRSVVAARERHQDYRFVWLILVTPVLDFTQCRGQSPAALNLPFNRNFCVTFSSKAKV